MSIAPWWWGVIMATKSRSMSPSASRHVVHHFGHRRSFSSRNDFSPTVANHRLLSRLNVGVVREHER